MQSEQLRALQAPLKEMYRAEPASAVAKMQVEWKLDPAKIACHRVTAETRQVAGLHQFAGGTGAELCSADMLLDSLAACAGVTLCAVATAMEIPLHGGSVTVAAELDFRGTLGVDRSTPIGLQNLSLAFQLDTTVEEAVLQKLLQLTERYCVIHQTLSAASPIAASIARTA